MIKNFSAAFFVTFNMLRSKLIYITLLLVLFSCKEDKNTPYFGYSYFGLEEGNFVEYEVTHIIHDENLTPKHDTSIFRIKTRIGEEILDNQGRKARTFYREIYNELYQEYQSLDLWTAIIANGKAELVEENQRKIKMIFAISSTKEWDANVYNTADELNCYYSDFHLPKEFNGFSFDSTIVVEQEDFISLIDYKRKYETYANGIGLVDVYYKDLRINNFDTLDISKGTELFYKILRYGKE